MKEPYIKYHKEITGKMREMVAGIKEYDGATEYHAITAGDPENSESYFLIEPTNKEMFVVDINAPTPDLAEAMVFHLLLITAITKRAVAYRNPRFHSLFEKRGAIRKIGDAFLLDCGGIKRYIKIGTYPTGKNNAITDVTGVTVGHLTLASGDINTGVTAVLPHQGNLFREKVPAGAHVFNGFGKPLGLIQIEELGIIETPILLTNTLNVGAIADGLIRYMLASDAAIADTTATVNPLVLECNDGYLNDIRRLALTPEDAVKAIMVADSDFAQGNVGAGTGMRCLGFKGGIGSSSRVIEIAGKTYTLGVLVNSNFQGGSSRDLKIKGRNIGELLQKADKGPEDKGSIIVVIATDLPLDPMQLRRVARRTELGIGNTGGFAAHGSGDVIVAFSVANRYRHFSETPTYTREVLHDDYINHAFRAIVEATEEAIINSMLHASPVTGYRGRHTEALWQHIESFDDLLIKEE